LDRKSWLFGKIGEKEELQFEKQSPALKPGFAFRNGLDLDNVDRLITLGALGDLEFHGLTFLQGFVTFALDGGVMDKHISTILWRDEPITFLIVEPLHFSFCHYGKSPSLSCAFSERKGLEERPASEGVIYVISSPFASYFCAGIP
jgi:hypothetical protein